jgi:hypothetical protein
MFQTVWKIGYCHVVEMARDDGVCLLSCFGMKLEEKWKGREGVSSLMNCSYPKVEIHSLLNICGMCELGSKASDLIV